MREDPNKITVTYGLLMVSQCPRVTLSSREVSILWSYLDITLLFSSLETSESSRNESRNVMLINILFIWYSL